VTPVKLSLPAYRQTFRLLDNSDYPLHIVLLHLNRAGRSDDGDISLAVKSTQDAAEAYVRSKAELANSIH
jgi:hypothetical protein